MTRPRGGARAPQQGDIGYASLQVPDAGRAAAFYAAVFGWEYEPSHNPRARQVPGATPPQGLWGGQPRTTLFCSATWWMTRWRRRRGCGRPAARPATPSSGLQIGLVADCTDNQGTRFAVHQYPAAGQPGAARGRSQRRRRAMYLAYITFEAAYSRLARDFYGAVLGWRFAPGSIADGWPAEGTTPMAGLSGGHAEATTVPMWRVADLQATVGRVRAAGGTAAEPRQEPYGLTADCTDDQGTRFYLGQFPARVTPGPPRPPAGRGSPPVWPWITRDGKMKP